MAQRGEVFQITDSWVFFRFDSADLYNKLDVGQKYKCKVAGWRIPFLSANRNILKAVRYQGGDQ